MWIRNRCEPLLENKYHRIISFLSPPYVFTHFFLVWFFSLSLTQAGMRLAMDWKPLERERTVNCLPSFTPSGTTEAPWLSAVSRGAAFPPDLLRCVLDRWDHLEKLPLQNPSLCFRKLLKKEAMQLRCALLTAPPDVLWRNYSVTWSWRHLGVLNVYIRTNFAF